MKKEELILYRDLLGEIKTRVRQAQHRAALSANAEMILMYWDIGRLIAARQKEEGWGAGVIPRLAADLKNELPEQKGFSERNIGYMIRFAREYGAPPILQPPAAKIGAQPAHQLQPINPDGYVILQPPVAKLPMPPEVMLRLSWAHHIILFEKLKHLPTRLWYARQALEQGWSRDTLAVQIKNRAHERQGTAVTNFASTLPEAHAAIAQGLLKDPYLFDFLTLEEPFHERELETGLLLHIQKFLLELGRGFAFVGRQYRLEISDREFYLDLLFYHLHLRCFVVVDLKKGEFKPEYAGKMNPVRYPSYESILLRLRSPKSQRRKPLCRRYGRSAIAASATRGRRRAIHSPPLSVGIDILRGVQVATRCLQAREVSENCVGQTLSQDAACRLSHGVNFYCSVVDDILRHAHDAPTIGMILCQTKDRVFAEYALRDIHKPIGVADYELTRALPMELASSLPSIEDLEAELTESMKEEG